MISWSNEKGEILSLYIQLCAGNNRNMPHKVWKSIQTLLISMKKTKIKLFSEVLF